MEGLFNPISILLHVLNAVILLVALYFLLYRPVHKYMNARSESVTRDLQAVVDAQTNLDDQRKHAQDELNEAKQQAADVIAQSVSQAQTQAQQVLIDAHGNAELTMKQARTEADALKKNAYENIRDEVATLSVELAGMILQREIKQEDHNKLVEEFLKKVG